MNTRMKTKFKDEQSQNSNMMFIHSLMKVIAVIPAYNEEIAIGSVVLKTKPHVDEVFVVDDGSSDYTVSIARAAGAIVVRHENNNGYGGALKTCFKIGKESNADVMVILDADGQHDPNYIENLLDPIQNGEADIAVGSRFMGNLENNIPAYRKIGMRIIDAITNSGMKTKVSDSQSGFRAYSRKAIFSLNINGDGMGAGAEILLDAASKNLNIAEVPITVRYDVGKHSQHPVVHGLSVVTSLIQLFAEKHALVSFGTIGLALLMIGLFEGISVVNIYDLKHELALGTALISVMITLIGTYLMFTGVILYVVRDLIERTSKMNNS